LAIYKRFKALTRKENSDNVADKMEKTTSKMLVMPLTSAAISIKLNAKI
jgi:hypothetical protein